VSRSLDDAQPESGNNKRLRTLQITGELFVELFKLGSHPAYDVIENAIPDDAEVRNVRFGWPHKIEILIESAEFDEVNDGEPIPFLVPVFSKGQPE